MATGDRIYIADKETLDKVYEIVSENEGYYGFIEHQSILSPTERIEYIGINKDYTAMTVNKTAGTFSYGSWGEFSVLVKNRPWMVSFDGVPDYELDSDDYSLKAHDGTASDVSNEDYEGNAMSWLCKIYKQEYTIGTDRYVKFRFTPEDGYEAVGFVDGDGKELDGVWIPMFYGYIDTNGRMRSIAGTQPDYNKATAAQKTAIDAVSERARFFGGPIIELIDDLCTMWGKSTNSQSVWGSGNSNGYDSTASPTYGVLANAIVGGGQFYGTSTGKALNKILHSIVLASYQQYQRDPYTLLVNGRFKVSKNYEYDITGATYEDTLIDIDTAGSWVYPNLSKVIKGFGKLPVSPFNGSSTLGNCDGLISNTNTSSVLAVALRLGACNHGSNVGLRCLNLHSSAAHAAWYLGASLLLLPQPDEA